MCNKTRMIRIILQDRDVALLRALPRAKVLTLRQIHKYFFKGKTEKAARRVLNRLEKAGFIANLRNGMKYAVSVNYSIWTLGRNGFSYLGMRPYKYHSSSMIFHQLKMNDVMMEFYDNEINSEIYWNGDGEFVFESELGSIMPDAVLKNPANNRRIFFEFDNSSKPRNPMIKNLEKYIVWFLSNSSKDIILHYCVSEKNRVDWIKQCFESAFYGLREKYHIHKDQLIRLEVFYESMSPRQLTDSIHDELYLKKGANGDLEIAEEKSEVKKPLLAKKKISVKEKYKQAWKDNELPESLF